MIIVFISDYKLLAVDKKYHPKRVSYQLIRTKNYNKNLIRFLALADRNIAAVSFCEYPPDHEKPIVDG